MGTSSGAPSYVQIVGPIRSERIQLITRTIEAVVKTTDDDRVNNPLYAGVEQLAVSRFHVIWG